MLMPTLRSLTTAMAFFSLFGAAGSVAAEIERPLYARPATTTESFNMDAYFEYFDGLALQEAVELEGEKPKLQNAQVYSFKELQESGFAFDDENDIDLSDYNSESYGSESISTPKTAEVREAELATPSTMNITSTTPFS